MKKTVIGVLGSQSAGKSETAAAIRHHARHTAITSFAFFFKEFAQEIFSFTNDTMWGVSDARNVVDQWFTKSEVWVEIERRFVRRAPGFIATLFGSSLTEKTDPHLATLRDWFSVIQVEALEHGLSCRHVLQTLGTEWGRKCDPDVWTNYTVRQAQNLIRAPDTNICVVEDVRQLNEASKLHSLGYPVWRVDSRQRLGESMATHSSELDIWKPEMSQYVSVELDNNRGIVELYRAVERELRRLP